MINFEDLIEGLMDKKEGIGSIEDAPNKEKVMNHLKMAKEMADENGLDFMSLVKECNGMDGIMADKGEDREEEMEEEEEPESSLSNEGQSAKQKALVMMLKSKKA